MVRHHEPNYRRTMMLHRVTLHHPVIIHRTMNIIIRPTILNNQPFSYSTLQLFSRENVLSFHKSLIFSSYYSPPSCFNSCFFEVWPTNLFAFPYPSYTQWQNNNTIIILFLTLLLHQLYSFYLPFILVMNSIYDKMDDLPNNLKNKYGYLCLHSASITERTTII